MRLFHPDTGTLSERHKRLHALYEIICTALDFLAAVLFIIGSVFFFDEATQTAGIWLFVVGSVCFAVSPALKLVREVHYWRIGAIDTLARRADE